MLIDIGGKQNCTLKFQLKAPSKFLDIFILNWAISGYMILIRRSLEPKTSNFNFWKSSEI